MLGMLDAGREPIIGQHGGDTVAGKELAHPGIKAATAIVARHPRAAVNQDDDGTVLSPLGEEHVQLMAVRRKAARIAIGNVADLLDLESSIRGYPCRFPDGNVSDPAAEAGG